MLLKRLYMFLFLLGFSNISFSQENLHQNYASIRDYSAIGCFNPISDSCGINALKNKINAELLKTNRNWTLERAYYENLVEQYITGSKIKYTTQSTITIPVVVHVLYNTAVQNISMSKIQ